MDDTSDIKDMIAAYRPNRRSLATIKKVRLLAVVGPVGVGKTTLIETAVMRDPALHIVVGDTSRLPRPGERDGIDYHFRNRTEMLARIARREYVQLPPHVTGDLYATAPESYAQGGLAVMAVWAEALPQFRSLPFASLCVLFVLPPSFAEWRVRLATRNMQPALFDARLREARRSLSLACTDPAADLTFVVNDNLQTAADIFLDIAHGRLAHADLEKQRRQGRMLAASLLEQLDAA